MKIYMSEGVSNLDKNILLTHLYFSVEFMTLKSHKNIMEVQEDSPTREWNFLAGSSRGTLLA